MHYWKISFRKKYQVFILADINIDFLKRNTHSLTEDYLEMLYTNNMYL